MDFKSTAKWSAFFAFGPVLIGPVMLLFFMLVRGIAFSANPFSIICQLGIAAAISGLIMLVVAKWPKLRKLDLQSFGVSGFPVKNKMMYLGSYLFMVFGSVLIFVSGRIG